MFTDLHEMIEKISPDKVAIPTATKFHYDLSMRVLGKGEDIGVEKPMCTSLVEADGLLATAVENDVCIALHHQGRTGGSMRVVESDYQWGCYRRLAVLARQWKGVLYAG